MSSSNYDDQEFELDQSQIKQFDESIITKKRRETIQINNSLSEIKDEVEKVFKNSVGKNVSLEEPEDPYEDESFIEEEVAIKKKSVVEVESRTSIRGSFKASVTSQKNKGML